MGRAATPGIRGAVVSGLLALTCPAAFAAAGTQDTEIFTGTYLMQVAASLIFVLGCLFGLLYVLKRMNGVAMTNRKGIQVLASVKVGTREKILLLEAGDVEGAAFWFALLADATGHPRIADRAAGLLGRIRVGSHDPQAVRSLLERGARVADPICMMSLGAGLTSGVFGPPEPPDLVSGARWLIRAHAAGVTGAISELQTLATSLDAAQPGLGFQVLVDGELLAGGTGALARRLLDGADG